MITVLKGSLAYAWPLSTSSGCLVHPRWQAAYWGIGVCTNTVPGSGYLGWVWWAHVVRAAWRRQALQIFMHLRGHKLHCLPGTLEGPGRFSGSRSICIETTQPHANLACCPCFSVTVDPNMLKSDVFVDFLKLVQLVSLLLLMSYFIAQHLFINHMGISCHQPHWSLLQLKLVFLCRTEPWRLGTGWVCVWEMW